MAKRSKLTVADVRKMLRAEQGGAVGQPDNTPNPKIQDAQKVDAERASQDSRTAETEGTGEPTQTSTLKEAKKDADAPVTVEERGRTAIVEPRKAERKG